MPDIEEAQIETEGTEAHFSASIPEERFETPDDRKMLERYKTPDDAFVGLIEARKTVSDPKRMFSALDKLDDKQRAALLEKVPELQGVPKTIEGYKDINFKAGLPDGAPDDAVSEDLKNRFLQYAVEQKKTPAQVQADIALWNTMQTETRMARDAQNRKMAEESMAELRKPDVWGYFNYPKNTETIRRYLRTFAANEDEWEKFSNAVYASGVGNNSILMRAILPAAQMMVGAPANPQGAGHGAATAPETNTWKENFPNSGNGPND